MHFVSNRNARIQLRIKQVTTTNDDTHMANVLYVDGDNAAGEFQKLSYLFQGPSLGDVKMSVQLGNSVTINFNKGSQIGKVLRYIPIIVTI